MGYKNWKNIILDKLDKKYKWGIKYSFLYTQFAIRKSDKRPPLAISK